MEQIPMNTPGIDDPKPGLGGWFQIWIKALTKPSEQTYIEIVNSPGASPKTAYIWVFIAGTLSGFIQAILQAIYVLTGTAPQIPIPELQQYMQPGGGGDFASAGIALVTSLCLTPVAGLLSVIFFALSTAVVQWIAKLFSGSGSYDKLVFAFAAISAPLTIISSLLSLFGAIPFIGACFGLFSVGLGIYVLVLQVMAVKGVNQFGWGPAAGSLLIPGLVIFIFCCCVLIIPATAASLLGPEIGSGFEQIFQNLIIP